MKVPEQIRFHVDRTFSGHCDHCGSGRALAAGDGCGPPETVEQRERTFDPGVLSQPCALTKFGGTDFAAARI